MQVKTFPIVLQDAYMLTPSVKHFVFKADLSPEFQYIPGQFITIHFPHDGKELKRSYSIANPPSEANRIEFAAGYVEGGPGTQLLFGLKPNDILYINGPFGRLILKEPQPKRYILVATSTGVTPYRAMLPALQQRLALQPDAEVVILLGVQKKEDVLYGNDFLAFANALPNAQFLICYSRAHDTVLQSFERRGYVQHAFEALKLTPDEDAVYLCGNPGMIDEAFEWLKENGFTTQHIVREKYISR